MTKTKTVLSIIAVILMLLIAVVTSKAQTTPQNFKVVSWKMIVIYPTPSTREIKLIPVYQHIQH